MCLFKFFKFWISLCDPSFFFGLAKILDMNCSGQDLVLTITPLFKSFLILSSIFLAPHFQAQFIWVDASKLEFC